MYYGGCQGAYQTGCPCQNYYSMPVNYQPAYPYCPGYGYNDNNNFSIYLVLFILLVIILGSRIS